MQQTAQIKTLERSWLSTDAGATATCLSSPKMAGAGSRQAAMAGKKAWKAASLVSARRGSRDAMNGCICSWKLTGKLAAYTPCRQATALGLSSAAHLLAFHSSVGFQSWVAHLVDGGATNIDMRCNQRLECFPYLDSDLVEMMHNFSSDDCKHI